MSKEGKGRTAGDLNRDWNVCCSHLTQRVEDARVRGSSVLDEESLLSFRSKGFASC